MLQPNFDICNQCCKDAGANYNKDGKTYQGNCPVKPETPGKRVEYPPVPVDCPYLFQHMEAANAKTKL